jgi:hypothetical protein
VFLKIPASEIPGRLIRNFRFDAKLGGILHPYTALGREFSGVSVAHD